MLLKSARFGSTNSLVQLGDMYYRQAKTELETPKCQRLLDEAMWWYQKASSKGHPLGSYYAGIMFQFGIGFNKNLARAVRYYNLALRQGGLVSDGSNPNAEKEASSVTFISNLIAAATVSSDVKQPGYSIGSQSTFTQSSAFWSILKLLKYVAINDPAYGNFNDHDESVLLKVFRYPMRSFLEFIFKI